MNTTTTINLGGRHFIIEETAKNKLQDYLAEIKKHCGLDADTEEVMTDIEIGMAEKLKAQLTPYKEVVTADDIEALIKVMGTVDDFDREIGADTAAPEIENSEPKNARRLYRDTDQALVGGVAAGLGVYFNIDPIIFRIIFIALVLAGGSGIFIYLILWLITPAAKSAHQKLEMQGQAPTVAAFERLAKKTSTIWKKNNGPIRSFLDKLISLPFLALKYLFLAIKKVWSALWPLVKFVCGLFLIIFGLLVLAAAGIGSFYLILQTNSAYRISYIPINELIKNIPVTWIMASGFLALAIPAILVLLGGLALLRKKSLVTFSVIAVLICVWMAAIITVSALGLRYFPEMREKIHTYPSLQISSQTIKVGDLKKLKATGYYLLIKVESGATSTAVISGRAVDLEKVTINNSGDNLDIKQINANSDTFCLDCQPQRVTVKISAPELQNIQATQADIIINKNFHQALNINADQGSLVNWEEAQAPALTAAATDEASINISGQIASSTFSIKQAELRLNNYTGNDLTLNLSGAAKLSGQIKNLFLTTSADCQDNCGLNAEQAKITALNLKTVGAPTIVLGVTNQITGSASDPTTIFYQEPIKISGSLKNQQLFKYKTLSSKEYDKLASDNYEDYQNIIDVNDNYYSLATSTLTSDQYQKLRDKFRSILE